MYLFGVYQTSGKISLQILQRVLGSVFRGDVRLLGLVMRLCERRWN